MSELSVKSAYPVRTVLWAGLLVGTLDISAAIIHFWINGGGNPIGIFVYIASGVFGKAAFEVGAPMAWWGLLFHYAIAYIWTAFFFLIYGRLDLSTRNWIVVGVVYGIFVWLMMNRVVLPLSGTPKNPFRLSNAIINCLILIGMIGLPLAYIGRRYYHGERSRS
jgi:hypothetical protein